MFRIFCSQVLKSCLRKHWASHRIISRCSEVDNYFVSGDISLHFVIGCVCCLSLMGNFTEFFRNDISIILSSVLRYFLAEFLQLELLTTVCIHITKWLTLLRIWCNLLRLKIKLLYSNDFSKHRVTVLISVYFFRSLVKLDFSLH